MRDVAAFFAGLTGGLNPVLLDGCRPGHTLDESPAHRGTLTDGSGCLTRCQLHIRSNFGSVSCSRILRHVVQSYPGELGFKPAIFWSLVNQLYPLSCSCGCIYIHTNIYVYICTYKQSDREKGRHTDSIRTKCLMKCKEAHYGFIKYICTLFIIR